MPSELKEKNDFEREIDLVSREVSPESAIRAYSTFVHMLRWLRRNGHGEIIISAVDRKFGTKIRMNTVVNVK